MIKLVAVGLWVCAVTLASGFTAVSWQSGRLPQPQGAGLFGGLTTVKTRLISVPIIAEGAVQGYVVTQLVFAIESSVLNRLSVKPDLILVDETIRTIYAGAGLDFRQLAKQDLPGLAKALADNVNSRVGTKLVDEVLIQELNYVPKDQVRKQ
jgi:hypothetical protein